MLPLETLTGSKAIHQQSRRHLEQQRLSLHICGPTNLPVTPDRVIQSLRVHASQPQQALEQGNCSNSCLPLGLMQDTYPIHRRQ